MTIKVENRFNPEIYEIYLGVDKVINKFVNEIYCHQLQIGNETATFPVREYKIYKQNWVEYF